MTSTNLAETNNRSVPEPLSIRRVTLLALMVFFASLTSSPSILRGVTPAAIAKLAPLLLIVMLAARGNFNLPRRFLLAWGACFIAMFASGLQIVLNSPDAMAPINSAIILLIVVGLAANLHDERFRNLMLKWWKVLFWIVALCSVVNWILAPLVPSLFVNFDFGQFYEGNARTYLISPFGAVILQNYGTFQIYRVTGLLAEPGMMSLFFFVNAILGLAGRSPVFSKRFGMVNLAAAFGTHSVAFYAALVTVLFYFVAARMGWRYRFLILAVACVAAAVFYEFVDDTVQALLLRSSFDVRENDAEFLTNLVNGSPLSALIGYAWWGEYRQLPAAFQQLFYQVGLIGAALYALVLSFFLKESRLCWIAVFVYGFSIDYQDFVILPLMLFIVKAHDDLRRPQQALPGAMHCGVANA
ncbi:hypothetical protein NX773_02285 [Massilia solisilvae]|uniref:Polymerase n=1 Tax=Massilia solisilvae TaxID=1811225 RepID=A0ABT2BEZ8_9BURK|nr:hypothetical protein [Massilia solisilvae]MCS0606991.1 hypothetical protein [Massilia solisilvae]